MPSIALVLLACRLAESQAPPAPKPAADPVQPSPEPEMALQKAVPSEPQGDPSFDCAHAAAPVEQLICSSPALSSSDRAMAAAWRAALAAAGGRKGELMGLQRDWLSAREGCRLEDCLLSMYEAHTAWLRSVPTWPEGDARNRTGIYSAESGTVSLLDRGDGAVDFLGEFHNDQAHIGEIAGRVALVGGTGSWASPDGLCALSFAFGPDELKIEQRGSDAQCGFGASVYADGRYLRTARSVPLREW